MTHLIKPVTRRVRVQVTGNSTADLVVTLRPGGFLELREAGRRGGVTLALGALYLQGCQAKANADRPKRKVKPKARLPL